MSKLVQANASGDDRTIGSSGSNSNYWYSVGDGFRLILCLRKKYLNYDGKPAVNNGEEYTVFRENNNKILVTDPYYGDNFSEYLIDDIDRITAQGNFSGISRWAQMPTTIIIPVLSGLHWRSIKVNIDYTQKTTKILFNDPYGQGKFPEGLKDIITTKIKVIVEKLIKIQTNDNTASLSEEIKTDEKQIDQQGHGENSWDCGPITFSNIQDYLKNNGAEPPNYSIPLYSDVSHNTKIIEIRELDRTHYSQIVNLQIDTERLDSINKKFNDGAKNQIQEAKKLDPAMEIGELGPSYIGMVFSILESQKLFKGKDNLKDEYTKKELEDAYHIAFKQKKLDELRTSKFAIEEINFKWLEKSQKESWEEYVNYGTNTLPSFLESVSVEGRNIVTDEIVLKCMMYAIKHYEKFKDTYTSHNKQSIIFSVCRTVPFLTNEALIGKQGLIDKYTIKHQYGFEDTNIFKDLKFLQKVTAAPKHEHSSKPYTQVNEEEVDGLLSDITGPLKQIIELELEDKLESVKQMGREKFRKVPEYPNTFSVAAYYREDQRSNEAIKNLESAIKFLEANPESYSSEQKLFVVFRALTVVGEFSTQKNLTLQTKLDNPELEVELKLIKNLANLIVKPTSYYSTLSNIKVDFTAVAEDLKLLKTGLEKAVSDAKPKKTSYKERVKYYTKPAVPVKPYLSQDLIEKIMKFTTTHFSEISAEKLNELYAIFSSGKGNIKYMAEISQTAKSCVKDMPGKMRKCNDDKKKLIQELEKYKPPVEAVKLSQLKSIEGLTKILESSVEEFGKLSATESKQSAINCTRTVLKQLKSHAEAGSPDIPKVNEDDNPITLNYDKLTVGEDSATGKDVVIISLVSKDTNKGDSVNIRCKIAIKEDKVDAIKNACRSINLYNEGKIAIPKKFLGIGKKFITETTISPESVVNTFKDNEDESINYLIEYGKHCMLYHFFAKSENKLILEFYFQTLYKLLEDINDDDFILDNKEEYRALRTALRHFEDNLDVMEVAVPIEIIYAHYAVKYIKEIEPKFLEFVDKKLSNVGNVFNTTGTKEDDLDGKGLAVREEESYWHQYSKTGMKELLNLRLESAGLAEKVKTIIPDYFWDESTSTAEKLANDITTNLSSEDEVLVVLNLYAKHWVGLAIDKSSDGQINIKYMDSEQNQMPALLKETLIKQLVDAYPEFQIRLSESELEPQKYNNCGPEVIENFMQYLTGDRLGQEDVVVVHSALLENSLLLGEGNYDHYNA